MTDWLPHYHFHTFHSTPLLSTLFLTYSQPFPPPPFLSLSQGVFSCTQHAQTVAHSCRSLVVDQRVVCNGVGSKMTKSALPENLCWLWKADSSMSVFISKLCSKSSLINTLPLYHVQMFLMHALCVLWLWF